jgi:hypothetical protein
MDRDTVLWGALIWWRQAIGCYFVLQQCLEQWHQAVDHGLGPSLFNQGGQRPTLLVVRPSAVCTILLGVAISCIVLDWQLVAVQQAAPSKIIIIIIIKLPN